jgi:hypothetical protein
LIAAYSLENLSSVIQKEFCNYRHLADVSLLPNGRFAPRAALASKRMHTRAVSRE